MRLPLLVAVLLAGAVWAAKPAPPPPKPVEAPTKKAVSAAGPAADVLGKLQNLYNALEYEEVLALGEAFTARTDLTIDQRLEGYRLLASAIVVVRDPSDAKTKFRLLLEAARLQGKQYALPQDTPPKILDVFKLVRTEFEAEQALLEAVKRRRTIESISIAGGPGESGAGGKPLTFRYRIKDPTGAVGGAKVNYRREGESVFNSLALVSNDSGEWKAVLPGDLTASGNPYRLQYYVVTSDGSGELRTEGTSTQPLAVPMTAGVPTAPPFKPIPKAVFFTSAGLTVIAAGLGLLFGSLMLGPQAEFNRLVEQSRDPSNMVQGRTLVDLQQRGTTYATAANVSYIVAGGLGLTTGLLAIFTKFVDEEP
jgi:hypothetical protein